MCNYNDVMGFGDYVYYARRSHNTKPIPPYIHEQRLKSKRADSIYTVYPKGGAPSIRRDRVSLIALSTQMTHSCAYPCHNTP